MEITDRSQKDPEYVLYARIWPRMMAILIDGVVLGIGFLVAALIGANIAGSGAVTFVVWVAFWILYDPLMVSRTGGTIGHHLQNLRVVSDKTGAPPSLVAAFIRNIVKGFFGTFSFMGIAWSSRQKAIHDWVAGTTVQASDLQLVRYRNFTRVRRAMPADEPPGPGDGGHGV